MAGNEEVSYLVVAAYRAAQAETVLRGDQKGLLGRPYREGRVAGEPATAAECALLKDLRVLMGRGSGARAIPRSETRAPSVTSIAVFPALVTMPSASSAYNSPSCSGEAGPRRPVRPDQVQPGGRPRRHTPGGAALTGVLTRRGAWQAGNGPSRKAACESRRRALWAGQA
jgi:hypothetical protein